MRKIPYIDYNNLAGFYTLQQVAGMLRVSIQDLAQKGKQYNIRLYRDDSGRYLLDAPAIKMLHYRLYHESRGRRGA